MVDSETLTGSSPLSTPSLSPCLDERLALVHQLHYLSEGCKKRVKKKRTLRRVQSPRPAAMFGVVVHEHVVGDGENVTIHIHRC